MKLKIDKKKCIGCGACVVCCPDVFEMKGEKASLKTASTDIPCAKQAADNCPVKAILVK